MKIVQFGAFYVSNKGLGQSPQCSPGAELRVRRSGGEAESFEAILHLNEDSKLVKTLAQSKYCALLQSSGVSVGGQSAWCRPVSWLGGAVPLAPSGSVADAYCYSTSQLSVKPYVSYLQVQAVQYWNASGRQSAAFRSV